ncbi:MAG: hypothetical protein J7M14_05795, partial [Planctomycetes bacterium]|nr:hypothetical protein [Planctomycetota bacterium]
ELREWTLRLPFPSNLTVLSAISDSPPIDAQGNDITDMPGWTQTLTPQWRDLANLTQPPTDGAKDVIYVQADIKHNGRIVLTTGWILIKRQ